MGMLSMRLLLSVSMHTHTLFLSEVKHAFRGTVMVLTHTHLFGNFAIGWDETLRNTQKASMWASPPEFIFFMVSFLLEKHIRPKTIGLHIYPEDGLVGDDLNKHGGGTTGNPTRLLSVPFFLGETTPKFLQGELPRYQLVFNPSNSPSL